MRSGKIHRHYGSDWFSEAVDKKIVTKDEARDLRKLDELVDKVIAVDQFAPDEVIPHYKAGKAKGAGGSDMSEKKASSTSNDKQKHVAAE